MSGLDLTRASKAALGRAMGAIQRIASDPGMTAGDKVRALNAIGAAASAESNLLLGEAIARGQVGPEREGQ